MLYLSNIFNTCHFCFKKGRFVLRSWKMARGWVDWHWLCGIAYVKTGLTTRRDFKLHLGRNKLSIKKVLSNYRKNITDITQIFKPCWFKGTIPCHKVYVYSNPYWIVCTNSFWGFNLSYVETGTSGLILGLCPANERWGYFVTMSLIGWAQT